MRHNVLLFAANMATSFLSYLYHPVVGHLLGVKGFGSIGGLAALSTILLIPAQFVTYIANKFAADLIAQGRIERVNYLLRLFIRYGFLAGVVSSLIFIGLSSVFASFLTLSSPHLVVIMGLGLVFGFVAPLNFGVIQGRQQFAWFGLLNFLTALLRVVTTAAVLLLGFGITGVLLAGLANGLVVYALSFVPIKDVLESPQERIPSFKPLLTYSLGTAIALSCGILLVNTDTLLAVHYLSKTDAGYYAAVAKMGQTVLFIGGSLVWVMFPKVATLHRQARSHSYILGWTIAGVAALSSAALAIFWLFPTQIMHILFQNTAPAHITEQLFWYGFAMLFLALSNVLMYYFLSIGWMRFVPLLVACCLLQAVLIIMWHQSVAQIVMAMVAVMMMLFAGLVACYALRLKTVNGQSQARLVG